MQPDRQPEWRHHPRAEKAPMRQVIVSNIMSVDDHYEGPVDARRFDGSDNVLLRYSVSR